MVALAALKVPEEVLKLLAIISFPEFNVNVPSLTIGSLTYKKPPLESESCVPFSILICA